MTNKATRHPINWADNHNATFADMIEIAQRYLDKGDIDMYEKICDLLEQAIKEKSESS